MFHLDRFCHQSLKEVGLYTKSPLRQDYRRQQYISHHIHDQGNLIVWTTIGQEYHQQGIEEEDDHHDKHHVAHTFGTKQSDVLQLVKRCLAKTSETGRLMLVLIINLQVIEIEKQSGDDKHSPYSHTDVDQESRHPGETDKIGCKDGSHTYPAQQQGPAQHPVGSFIIASDINAIDERESLHQQIAHNGLGHAEHPEEHGEHEHRHDVIPEIGKIGEQQKTVPHLLGHRSRLEIIVHSRAVALHHHLQDDIGHQRCHHQNGTKSIRSSVLKEFLTIKGASEVEA